MTFFSWSPRWGTAGITLHESLDEARAYAEGELHAVRVTAASYAPKLHTFRASGICYGKVLGRSTPDKDAESGYVIKELPE